jgi:glycosyltransferase involved in cell wall biosynthesis
MNNKVVIAGCTKNSAKYIQYSINKLHEIGNLFTDYTIVLYENDSTDNTVEILHKNTNKTFHFISERNIIIKYKLLHTRAQILCHARNKLLEHIKLHYVNYDLLIMIDLDNVLEQFNPKTLLNAFKYGDDWEGLTANCVGKYYDIWALRINHNIWNNDIHGKIWPEPLIHDCWNEIKDGIPCKYLISNYQQIIPISMPLIQTTSSFGGIGIYKMNAIQNARYETYNGNFCQCEHVMFNEGINGKLFICPSLLIKCPVEHII